MDPNQPLNVDIPPPPMPQNGVQQPQRRIMARFLNRLNALPSVKYVGDKVVAALDSDLFIAQVVKQAANSSIATAANVLNPLCVKYETQLNSLDSKAVILFDDVLRNYNAFMASRLAETIGSLTEVGQRLVRPVVDHISSTKATLASSAASIKQSTAQTWNQVVVQANEKGQMALEYTNARLAATPVDERVQYLAHRLAASLDLKDYETEEVARALDEIPRGKVVQRIYFTLRQLSLSSKNKGRDMFQEAAKPVADFVLYPMGKCKPVDHPVSVKLMTLTENYQDNVAAKRVLGYLVSGWSWLLYFDGKSLENDWRARDTGFEEMQPLHPENEGLDHEVATEKE